MKVEVTALKDVNVGGNLKLKKGDTLFLPNSMAMRLEAAEYVTTGKVESDDSKTKVKLTANETISNGTFQMKPGESKVVSKSAADALAKGFDVTIQELPKPKKDKPDTEDRVPGAPPAKGAKNRAIGKGQAAKK